MIDIRRNAGAVGRPPGARPLAALFACALAGCTPPPSPPASPPVSRATVVQAPKAGLIASLAHAYETDGHKCIIDKDGDAICDKEDKDKFTVIFTYDPGAEGRRVQLITAFPWKEPDPCAALAPKFNEIQNQPVWFRIVCAPTHLTFAGALDIPELGLTDHDVNLAVTSFTESVRSALSVGGLATHMK